jgi:chromatin assembly factor 1 subunit A
MERPELELKAAKVINPDFSSWILPFFPHDHTEVAPFNRFLQSHRPTSVEIPWLDSLQHTPEPSSVLLTETITPSIRRKRLVRPVKDIVQSLAGSEDSPIGLTGRTKSDLAYVSYKILSFREDFRPPYQGTFTRVISPRTARKLSRNPTHRGMPKVDYDYNSEAEWEAPEAGDEDLEDDDEMSDEEDAADEMADFLDVDGEETARRRVLTSDVEPICTGLCWEGEEEVNISGLDLARYRMDVLHDDMQLPIDPYSPSHWSHSFQKTPLKAKAHPSSVDETMPAMQPPRLPLVAVSAPNGSPLKKFITINNASGDGRAQKENVAPDGQKKAVRVSQKPTKTIPHDLLPSFRAAVSGSDLNKVALIEILKKQFPKCPKDAIKGTLETIAIRQGVKEVDKRWVLLA